mmetsp:Transcript_110474/g.246877  ORF Transcript_110474/g.246877 Transcript_110474/m.246877 type:complete len:231 (+) Transcript_110474:802-1494(+)
MRRHHTRPLNGPYIVPDEIARRPRVATKASREDLHPELLNQVSLSLCDLHLMRGFHEHILGGFLALQFCQHLLGHEQGLARRSDAHDRLKRGVPEQGHLALIGQPESLILSLKSRSHHCIPALGGDTSAAAIGKLLLLKAALVGRAICLIVSAGDTTSAAVLPENDELERACVKDTLDCLTSDRNVGDVHGIIVIVQSLPHRHSLLSIMFLHNAQGLLDGRDPAAESQEA